LLGGFLRQQAAESLALQHGEGLDNRFFLPYFFTTLWRRVFLLEQKIIWVHPWLLT
jgi:hypothetical protein